MQQYNFDEQSLYGDWTFTFSLDPSILADGTTWGVSDQVIFRAKPDFAYWDDYGWRQTGPGPTSDPYWLSATSDDGSGQVSLVAPSTVVFWIKGGSWRGCAPGMVNVGARYVNLATDRSIALWRGRLPLVDGVA